MVVSTIRPSTFANSRDISWKRRIPVRSWTFLNDQICFRRVWILRYSFRYSTLYWWLWTCSGVFHRKGSGRLMNLVKSGMIGPIWITWIEAQTGSCRIYLNVHITSAGLKLLPGWVIYNTTRNIIVRFDWKLTYKLRLYRIVCVCDNLISRLRRRVSANVRDLWVNTAHSLPARDVWGFEQHQDSIIPSNAFG